MTNQIRLFYGALAMLFAVLLLSCSGTAKKHRELRASRADSILFDIGVGKDYDHLRAVTDSFEMVGDLSPLDANRWRGTSYYRQGQYNMAEVCYRKAMECKVESQADQQSYNKCARRLSELLLIKGDYEGSLRVAIPAVKKMDESGIGSDIDYAILLNNIGCCQLNLGQDKEANESFLTAREHYANRWQSDTTSRGFQEAVIGTVYTSMAYINTRRYEESIYWIDRTEMLLNNYRTRPDARVEYFDEYQGRIEIMRAVAQQGLGKTNEASKAYEAFLKTDYSKTDAGRINANDYLVAAHRYKEAADNYRCLDKMMADAGLEMSLDNIQLYMLPKYLANAEAGRGDSARVAARRILLNLDEAITGQKNSAMAELATIYDTQGKETEIARQQVEMSKQRLMATAVALILVFTFFIIYTLHKRNSTHKLAAAHAELQKAYNQLEETTTAKERIESELRIARDIQMSMVPNVSPDREGLDLYASMTPAKEVGGDLYGYLLIGDDLYFCVGDVSGKGVPASLFMAQATRLFRTLAAQKMMPAEIATRMNDALTENNERGMFVTMFLGLVNLETGRLDFCNAGHNPPVIYDQTNLGTFIEMESNAPIGLWPELEFVGETIESIKGKPFFVYTDGLNEAENPEQEQFGDERMLEFLHHAHFRDARELVETLKAEVERFRQGADPNDDMTMLCLKVK
jgi:serine phosphatase RsbU (regulator of sigma subunit)